MFYRLCRGLFFYLVHYYIIMFTKVLIESLFVGILLILVGKFTLGKNIDMKKLFFTGVLVHIICEVVGLNTWYCKNGSACKGLKN